MNQEEIDPFVAVLNKWKGRVEQLALFLFLILHLILIGLVGLSMLWLLIQKIHQKSISTPEVKDRNHSRRRLGRLEPASKYRMLNITPGTSFTAKAANSVNGSSVRISSYAGQEFHLMPESSA